MGLAFIGKQRLAAFDDVRKEMRIRKLSRFMGGGSLPLSSSGIFFLPKNPTVHPAGKPVQHRDGHDIFHNACLRNWGFPDTPANLSRNVLPGYRRYTGLVSRCYLLSHYNTMKYLYPISLTNGNVLNKLPPIEVLTDPTA